MKISAEYDVLVPAPFGFVGIAFAGDHASLALLSHAAPIKQSPDSRALDLALPISRYLQDPRNPLSPLVSPIGTPFQQTVWRAIALIPVGTTITYAQLATQVQSGPRAVANACGANPTPLLVPCHRVVASNGLGGFMQGHAQGLTIKQWLLQHEQAVMVEAQHD